MQASWGPPVVGAQRSVGRPTMLPRSRTRTGPSRKGDTLVLVSFGLVILAAVLLLIGLVVDSGLALIYASIGSSLAAGILLVLATRAQRAGSRSVVPAPAAVWGPPPPPPPPAAVPAAAPPLTPFPSPEEDYLFPIGNYEQLSEAEILPLLTHLYEDELDMVEARELRGAGRGSVLTRIDEVRRRYRAASPRPPADGGPADQQAS